MCPDSEFWVCTCFFFGGVLKILEVEVEVYDFDFGLKVGDCQIFSFVL